MISEPIFGKETVGKTEKMFEIDGLECISCGSKFQKNTLFEGCELCRDRGIYSNVTVTYKDIPQLQPETDLCIQDQSMWRYRSFLGVKQNSEVTLGEGLTPLIKCEALGREIGIKNFFLKNESQNPTGSYKDRLASAAVTSASTEKSVGIATSSTGNHGAATAAYAAKAGLSCIVFTIPEIPDAMLFQMQTLGAMLIATEKGADRWPLLKFCVEELGWYSTGNYSDPPIGSSPYGIEGYKTIAYEITETLNWSAPDSVVMPVAYGDGLKGVYKGFQELEAIGWIDKLPRMIAVETGGSLTQAVENDLEFPQKVDTFTSNALSIYTPISTLQALQTIRESNGKAVRVPDPEIFEAQRILGSYEGLLVEPASAAVVAGIARLEKDGSIGNDEVVVGILTATGLKYPAKVSNLSQRIPIIEPDSEVLLDCLNQVYSYQL
jgi:threonine synthase